MNLDISASIDNVTVLGAARPELLDWLYDDYMVSRRAQLFKLIPAPEDYISYRSGAKYPYRWQFVCTDGSVLQLAEKSAHVPPLRIEFNPNKAHLGYLLPLFEFVHSGHITRMDVAIDYKGGMS